MDVKSYRSPKTKVRKSAIEGYGLSAAQPIKKGELVGIKGGHIIGWNIFRKNKKLIGDSYLQIGDNFILAPLKRSEVNKVMMFLNHSCEPNIGVRGQIDFVAMRDIKAGEEITFDYVMTESSEQSPDYAMKCRCGSKNCRRVITGNDWKLPVLQKRYKGYFSAYIQEKIDR